MPTATKLKRKEQQPSTSTTSAVVAAAELVVKPATVAVSCAKDQQSLKDASSLSTVACMVQQKRLEISDPPLVKIISLSNIACDLLAFVDSGSPFSFISPRLYQKYLNCKTLNNNDSVTGSLIGGLVLTVF